MVVELKFKRTLSDVSVGERLAFARRHHLSRDESKRFFATIESWLRPSILAMPVDYSRRRRRQAVLGKIANDLRGAAKGSRRAAETMTDLMDATPSELDGWRRDQEHPLGPLLPDVEKVTILLDWLVQQVDEQRAQWSYPEPWDRRKPSMDRDRIVRQLLRFWAQCDRPLTYTTETVGGATRSGPLIDFLQDALMLLTDPPAALHPETLAKTIKEDRDLILFSLKREAEYAELVAQGGTDPFE